MSFLSLVTIRHATRTDLLALEWNGEYAHYRRLYRDIYRSSLKGEAVLWVAELKGVGIIGQLFVQLISVRRDLADGHQRAYIYGFRVMPAYRGHGLGTRMMSVAEADLARRGFRWVVLNVGRDNLEARQLYERLGYRVVAAEPGRWSYLDDQGVMREVNEPAWRMEKELRSAPQG
jgi:ribosomal protein S18 acetylase RimI-like enzyme